MKLPGGQMIARIAIGAAVGGLAGLSYQHFIGCRTGTCPITSNAWISTLYGALMGVIVSWG
ncbi:MAG TPA: DUF6132 family protein [bacterium]|nr:DUF6132 family protein [bacterium]